MPAPSPDERLAALNEKKRQLDAQIARLNAQKTAENRKRDTRRKILAGAVVLKEAEGDPLVKKWLNQLLDKRLLQPRDRSYFEIPAQPETISESEANDNEQSSQRPIEGAV